MLLCIFKLSLDFSKYSCSNYTVCCKVRLAHFVVDSEGDGFCHLWTLASQEQCSACQSAMLICCGAAGFHKFSHSLLCPATCTLHDVLVTEFQQAAYMNQVHENIACSHDRLWPFSLQLPQASAAVTLLPIWSITTISSDKHLISFALCSTRTNDSAAQ